MARKPPDWRQPSLFPPDPGSSPEQAPADTPEPQDPSTRHPEGGNHHEVQNDSPRTAATTAPDAGAAPQETQAPFDPGTLRPRAEDQPRSLEGTPLPDEAGQRPEPDRERSLGDSSEGTG